MDRDRRPRDVPPEDQFGNGRGQSYRPDRARERTPPRINSYRARSPGPPRRSEYLDSYRGPMRGRSRSPPPPRNDFRRRSPSPRFRDQELRGGDSYRAPPPRREELPRDDLFRREPARDGREYPRGGYRDDPRDRAYNPPPRSPLPRFRERSPLPLKRTREPSPISSRGRRTPPPPKRERLATPPRARYDDYPPARAMSPPRRRFSPDSRSRQGSPPRGPVRDFRARSRSPPPPPPVRHERSEAWRPDERRRAVSSTRESRPEVLGRDTSGQSSATTSRRSSPPLHPSRVALQQPASDGRAVVNKASPRESGRESSRDFHAATPTEPRRHAPVAPADTNTPPGKLGQPREPRGPDDAPSATPRAPPTGPAGQRGISTPSGPPTGPSASSSLRTPNAPPSGPRGVASSRGDFAPRGRGGFGGEYTPRGRGSTFGLAHRGGRGGIPSGPSLNRAESFGRGESAQSEASPINRGAAPPSGPRASAIPHGPAATHRQSSATPTTFSRSRSFMPNGEASTETPVGNVPPTGPKAARRPVAEPVMSAPTNRPHPALADLPQLVEGGKRAEPIIDRSKIAILEEEAEKLRRQIEERETRNRRSLREWDRMARETEAAALRSELAENALRQLNGEADLQAAF